MLVLFDQGTPAPLRKHLKGHVVKLAYQQGWATLRNGELLEVAEKAGFNVLLTTDKNLAYQQNLKNRAIAIVVLDQSSWPVVRQHIERIKTAVDAAKPGSYTVVEIPLS
jgi:hypothetical protein